MRTISEKKPEETQHSPQSGHLRAFPPCLQVLCSSRQLSMPAFQPWRNKLKHQNQSWLYTNLEQLQQTQTGQLSHELLAPEGSRKKGRGAGSHSLKHKLPKGLATSGSSSLLQEWDSWHLPSSPRNQKAEDGRLREETSTPLAVWQTLNGSKWSSFSEPHMLWLIRNTKHI